MYDVLFSTINKHPCLASKSIRLPESLEELQRFDIEEADVKIIIHINHAVLEGYKKVYLLSPDTDVIVLSLYSWENFEKQGLQVKIYTTSYITLLP